jgi:biotin/methionine sulfoxide reductase
MPQLIPPVGEARDDYAIFAGLAERLGAGEAFTEGRSAADWIETLYADYRARAAARGRGARSRHAEGRELGAPADPQARDRTARFSRPSGKTPRRAARHALGPDRDLFPTIAGFGYDDCPGHPVWLPPGMARRGDRGGAAAPRLAAARRQAAQPARKRPRRCAGRAARTAGAPPRRRRRARDRRWRSRARVQRPRQPAGRGPSSRPTSAPASWRCPPGPGSAIPGGNIDPHGNPNVLTRDIGTSRLGQGCSAHTALVEVAPLTAARRRAFGSPTSAA